MPSGLIKGPAWIAPDTGRFVGQNPLAVGRHVTAQTRKFAIAATSTTFHARYYSLHGLVAAESRDRGLSQSEQIDLLRRCEVVLGGISIAHRECHPGMLHIHGINAIRTSLDSRGELFLPILAGQGAGRYTKRRWGFRDYYAAAETATGLVHWREGLLVPGPGLNAKAVREGLCGLVELARHERLDLATLQAHSELCICRMAGSADGRALRDRLLAEGADPMSWEGRSAQTIRLLLRLLDLHGGGTGELQDDLGPFLLFDPVASRDETLASLDATSAWKGLVLRDISVRAWHRLWEWLVDQIDGAMPVERLGEALADALPTGSLARYIQGLPERLTGSGPDGLMLPAEELVTRDQGRTLPDRCLATLMLGAKRMDELPTRVAAYFEDPGSEGRSRLRPGWVRAQIQEWSDRPLREFAAFLAAQMASRAQQIALTKARFNESTGLYEVPSGVSIHDGLAIRDSSDWTIDVWFRWNAIVRILAGVGLTDQVDGQWQVTEEGRLV